MARDGWVKCHYHDHLIDPKAETSYRRVWGWQRIRYQGGANQIHLRKELEEWCCDAAIRDLKRGVDPSSQSTLI